MDAQVPPLPALRIAIVPGVTPGKWVRRWEERVRDVPLTVSACDEAEQAAVLWDGRADLSFVRLPVDREGLSVIPLYTEVPVVVAPKDHDIELYDDDVPLAELDGQNFLDPVEMGGAKTGVEVVASGAGLMILPMSVARLHNRKDVVYKPLSGAPETQIGVAWITEKTNETIEEFIGIVRGRTANSSRQPSAQQEAGQKDAKAGRKPAGGSGGKAGQAKGSQAKGGQPGGKAKAGSGKGGSGKSGFAKGRQPKGGPAKGGKPRGKGPRKGGH
jgi:hypothetical protein